MPRTSSNSSILAVLVSLFCASSQIVFASWVTPSEAPVDRIIKNAQAWVDANPKDPRGYFVLGRIHSYAFALNTNHLRANFSDEEAGQKLPNVITNPHIQTGSDPEDKTKRLSDEQRRKHLTDSITNYRKAAQLHATSGMTRLGLAYVLEVGAVEAPHIGLPPGSEEPAAVTAAQRRMFEPWIKGLSNPNENTRAASETKLVSSIEQAISLVLPLLESKDEALKAAAGRLVGAYWRELAIKEYQLAYDYSVAQDTKEKLPKVRNNLDLHGIVSLEAARAYVELVNARKPKPAERAKLVQMTALTRKYEEAQTEIIITPIILSIDQPRSLAQLLAPQTFVQFDLDGSGKATKWPWVRPETGFLVWDPSGKGRITSGRQMFGSVTWWMFWRDGYEALASLDDDRDGLVQGDELRGLSIWFDLNSNGVSDAGEVVSVQQAGIESIVPAATTHAGDVNQSPANPKGLRMKDGRVLPTYDWIVSAAK